MRYASLCSGIEGIGLGLELLGPYEPAAFVEIEPTCQDVLREHFPGVPIHGDLKALDPHDLPPFDVLTAGYPCQPFSHAGKRGGADDPRHLWPDVARTIRVLRPGLVLLENVTGHLSLGFGQVLGDLAEAGYDAEWVCLRASDVGACHRRERVFIVARPSDAAEPGPPLGEDGRRVRERSPAERGGLGPATHPGSVGRRQGPGLRAGESGGLGRGRSDHPGSEVAADAPRHERRPGGEAVRRPRERVVAGGVRPDPAAADPEGDGSGQGRPGGPVGSGPGLPDEAQRDGFDWGPYRFAIRRWERMTRPAPHPVDDRGHLAPEFVEWMMGFPPGWVASMGRKDALKALGNAVMPQQAATAFAALSVPVLEPGAVGVTA